MALDARTRSSIYGKLVPIFGEHDANALMSEFPSIEADELVTKQFLRAELGELRSELKGDIMALDSKLGIEVARLEGTFTSEVARLEGTLGTEVARLDGSIAGLRVEMADRFRQQTTMFGGALAAATALIIAAMPLLT